MKINPKYINLFGIGETGEYKVRGIFIGVVTILWIFVFALFIMVVASEISPYFHNLFWPIFEVIRRLL